MEVSMKKTAFFLLLLFSIVISSEVLAKTDTEYEKAMHYYNQGKFKEAAKLLKEYVERKPDAVAYYRAGYALYKIKRFDEANDYFQQAYLLDPTFSPQIAGPTKEQPLTHPQKVRKSRTKPALSQTEPSGLPPEAPVEQKQQEAPTAEPDLQRQQPAEGQPKLPAQDLKKGSIAPRPEQPLSQTPKVDPGKRAPMPPFPVFPKSPNMPPVMAPGLLMGLLAGFATGFLILGLAVYVYFCLCIFLIAKKLGVPNPWLAWIPLVQLWTVVNCAGKPWWWLLLLLVPIVSFIVSIMLWMSISENLGRNKWLGLLMLLPIFNLIYIGILAFSKGEKNVSMPEAATPA